MNINEFMNTDEYKNFINLNPGVGKLKVRSYAASEALPVSGLHIVVSTEIGNTNVVFFDGVTDASGVIDTISLPAPKLLDNLMVPSSITYKIVAGDRDSFFVNIYDGICVLQNTNYVPGEVYGS